MSSTAQVLANQANSKKSTGPVSAEGKARVAANHLSHGLTCATFNLLSWEDQDQFNEFAAGLKAETNPQTADEHRLVHAMIQHYWLAQRALTLQHLLLHEDALNVDQKRMALYIRYQTTNDRAYFKARKEFETLRKQKRSQEIGFESQKQKVAETEARVRLTHARAEALEVDNEVRKTVEVPLPGNVRLQFSDIHDAFAAAIRSLADEMMAKAAS